MFTGVSQVDQMYQLHSARMDPLVIRDDSNSTQLPLPINTIAYLIRDDACDNFTMKSSAHEFGTGHVIEILYQCLSRYYNYYFHICFLSWMQLFRLIRRLRRHKIWSLNVRCSSNQLNWEAERWCLWISNIRFGLRVRMEDKMWHIRHTHVCVCVCNENLCRSGRLINLFVFQ